MARRIAAVVFSLGCLHTGAVSALGLGELTLDSYLNEPFKARVDLLNTEGLSEHQIRIRLATPEDFNRMGVDRAYFLTSITFEVEIDNSGRGQILLTSETPVLEPYLDFIVEARWPSGRLLREYTVLVDPPVFDSSRGAAVSAREVIAGPETVQPAKKKSAAPATSGTRVKIAPSDLPAGEMPQRNFGSDAASTPLSGNRYMIKRDETLWSIAQRARPEGATVHQTMLDIQRLNPKAFIGGNINRIKAGYIIYLPSAGEISSSDNASAVAEVRQQNEVWRDDVSAGRIETGRASLRISAEPVNDAGPTGATSNAATGSDMAALEDLDRSERDRAEVEQRLAAMEEQLVTLERIVSLKDDQIATLQKALAEASGAAAASDDTGQGPEDSGQPADQVSLDTAIGEPVSDAAEAAVDALPQEPTGAAEDVVVEEQAPQQPAQSVPAAAEPEAPAVTPEATENQGGLFSNITYVIGLLVLAALAVWAFLRRRSRGDDEDSFEEDDMFRDIKLEDEPVEVVGDAETDAPATAEPARVEVASPTAGAQVERPAERGYGGRKNDGYVEDSVDALAEADIYIAYGRFPQAIELLKTAISGEPHNPAYKLKLMEISTEAGDQAELMRQYEDIKALGDSHSLARADEILRAADGGAVSSAAPVDDPLDLSDDLDLDLPGMDDTADGDLDLEEEFGELEIEGFDSELGEDDLDLSKDFAPDENAPAGGETDEEMVFATEGDPVSTKLDLARAYLDMGDEDGARLIFEEVIAEGNDEQKQEALALLERLG